MRGIKSIPWHDVGSPAPDHVTSRLTFQFGPWAKVHAVDDQAVDDLPATEYNLSCEHGSMATQIQVGHIEPTRENYIDVIRRLRKQAQVHFVCKCWHDAVILEQGFYVYA